MTPGIYAGVFGVAAAVGAAGWAAIQTAKADALAARYEAAQAEVERTDRALVAAIQSAQELGQRFARWESLEAQHDEQLEQIRDYWWDVRGRIGAAARELDPGDCAFQPVPGGLLTDSGADGVRGQAGHALPDPGGIEDSEESTADAGATPVAGPAPAPHRTGGGD